MNSPRKNVIVSKDNSLSIICVLLIALCIVTSPPFVFSLNVPAIIRIPLLVFLVLFFFSFSILKREFLVRFLPFLVFFIFLEMYWLLQGNSLSGSPVYFFVYVTFAFSLLVGLKRIHNLKYWVNKFMGVLVVGIAIQAVLSFLVFNLNIIPFSIKQIGEEAFYTNYYNPLFGYLDFKKFDFGFLGRTCSYFFEPSYLGWFLTSNFFMVKYYFKGQKNIMIIKVIVLLGALSTCSTASYLIFVILLIIHVYYVCLKSLKISIRMANTLLIGMIFLCIMILFLIPKQTLFEAFGPSSAEDRGERVSASFLILANSSSLDLIFGKSPGYIEKQLLKGESNEIIKSFVETGLISVIFILWFVIFCTYKNKYFMISNLIFLNSVVILFTPIFIITLVICKLNESQK